MAKELIPGGTVSRRDFSIGAGCMTLLFTTGIPAEAAQPQSLDERFDYLSKNGDSACTPAFADSIAKMPMTVRLRGSCCAEMDRKRYAEQVQGLTKYAAIAEIPPDPYNIAAGVAQKRCPTMDWRSPPISSVPINTQWINRTTRGRAAARAGDGRCMAAWRSS